MKLLCVENMQNYHGKNNKSIPSRLSVASAIKMIDTYDFMTTRELLWITHQ